MKNFHFPHNRLIAALLVLACMPGLLPTTAFAADSPSTINVEALAGSSMRYDFTVANTSNPTLTVSVSGTAANVYQLVNRADVGGKYHGTWQTGQAAWVTIVRKLTPSPKLPKTDY